MDVPYRRLNCLCSIDDDLEAQDYKQPYFLQARMKESNYEDKEI
jgi:hypothetical protein